MLKSAVSIQQCPRRKSDSPNLSLISSICPTSKPLSNYREPQVRWAKIPAPSSLVPKTKTYDLSSANLVLSLER